MTSATICMTKGDFFATPPIAITSRTGIPSSAKRSTIRREPNAVASTSARNIRGASLPSVSPVIAPRSDWSASGVRRPFIQSTARIPDSPAGMRAAAAESSGMIRSTAASRTARAVSASRSPVSGSRESGHAEDPGTRRRYRRRRTGPLPFRSSPGRPIPRPARRFPGQAFPRSPRTERPGHRRCSFP